MPTEAFTNARSSSRISNDRVFASQMWRAVGSKSARVAAPSPRVVTLRKCGCGKIAMPGESTCYTHQ